MKAAQIIVLGVAVAAAGGAGMLAMNLAEPPPPPAPTLAAPEPVVQTTRVLVATQTLPVGMRIDPEMLEWRDWPLEAVAEGFITEDAEPSAVDELSGATVRLVSFAGEPVRRAKLVGSDERYMSSVLEAGKRAMAVNISAANGAGGFILPNDRVDVIVTRNLADFSQEQASVMAQTVLTNVRVLAIDQTITESEEGGKTAIGETATVEVTAREAELLAEVIAQNRVDDTVVISLVLRSSADVSETPTPVFARQPHRNVTVIQGGELQLTTSKGLK